MKHTIKGLYAVICILQTMLIVSCAKDDLNWLIGTPINVVATSGSTRSASDIQSANFEAGTVINAYYCVTGGQTIGEVPTLLTASARDANGKNVLDPHVQPYYPQSGTVDIYALYPTTVTSASTDFTVQADQSSDDNYKISDLMWAGKTAQAKTANDVELTFSHLMAKITVDVTSKEGVTINSVKLKNAVRTIPIQNLQLNTRSLGRVTATNDEALKTITIGEASPGVKHIGGAALFPPQTIAANFIEVVTNYGTALYSVNKTFESGKQYTVNLTVTRQQIGFTTSINDWTSDGGSIAVPPGSSAGLKIVNIPNQPYRQGVAIEPTLTITYAPNAENGQIGTIYSLTKDKDYVAEFFNNTHVGTATVIITGKYNSENTDSELRTAISKLKASTSFEITTATGNIAYSNSTKTVDYVYYGSVSNDLQKNGGDGNFTYSSSDENVATVSISGAVTIKGVGTTTITANMDNQGNYTAATASYTLTVKPRKISTAVAAGEIVITPSVVSVPYNGMPYQPAVTVTDQGRILQKGIHYQASYANNINQGTATITIKGEENGVYDSSDTYKTITTFTITQVATGLRMDNDAVTLPVGFNVTRKASTKYGTITYSSDNTKVASVENGVVTAVAEGTARITATVTKDENDNYPTTSESFYVTVIPSEWAYDYTGTVQSWQCPLSGIYKLGAYGAQGGSNRLSTGGAGAYIAGQLFIKKNQILYIYVGQQGINATTISATQGGWNGGGKYTGENTEGSDQTNYCGGGGATDFSLQGTDGSTVWDTDEHWKSRILVAGGGGGALLRYVTSNYQFMGGGGAGGAYDGEKGYGGSVAGGGATRSAPGVISTNGSNATAASFGKGGGYAGTYSVGMGGGGWYGGASGATDSSVTENASTNTYSRQGSGGGGSSYIWNSANATYYSGHGTNNAPSVASNSVMTNASDFYLVDAGLTLGTRSGNGRAVITYMGEDE